MGDSGAKGLFGDLREQMAPVSEGQGAARPRLRQPDRAKVALRPISLEALLPEDHRARQVWAFVERLDLGPLYRAIKAVEGRPGHPPADPRLLVALWLHATVEGIGSARALARLCKEHHGYQWLCGGVSMNPKTLSDFRVAHGALLDRLLSDSFAAMVKAGLASLERVAQDGMRVRASAGAASFRRGERLKVLQEAAAQRVAELRRELHSDPGATSRRQASARLRAAEDRQRRVAAALEAMAELKPKADRKPRVSTTDAEARVMKMADGGFRPAYNVQFASDTESGMTAGVMVDAVGSDMGKLEPMSDQLASHYDERPQEHLGDGGYAALVDIAALDDKGVTAYVPVPKPKDPTRDRHAPRPEDSPAVAEWRERMGGEEAKAIYKERAATAEWANAQARNRGLYQFPVRGVTKVTAIALWFALAHNMTRIFALGGLPALG